ncbi:hypothetical protein PC129_g12202 [Phytophthora cactorum]|uniref:Uncharacterized protein n=1 Tax=Phytophthora cactorum TaxID=29920 RepID=A0A329T090_9STRA|nr:hypothetical protein Pcac1_g6533 [Phytophthora cactorum]KAG2822663.1 hypothetical protein PC112_g10842 [Phytophthora cactorum]KAG2846663.1 hypothetical protein PC111_g1147 [Phytophthora cactorum]KAG2866174.1 hypothetical protein PC113_g3062 [Phytophthora cactorum]KAG2904514.1 hypothetical protein PC114_g11834 [Phytophthora cactorum]
MFTSSKTKEFQGLLKVEDNLGNDFKKLGLSTMPIGKNDYIKDPDGAMFTALTNVFGEKNVATVILLGKHLRGSSTVAKKLEKAQFNKWYAKDNHLSTAEKVLNVKSIDIHMNSREKIISEAYTKYILDRVMTY